MNKIVKLFSFLLLMGLSPVVLAQEASAEEEKQPVYQIIETLTVPHTAVDNQGSSGTCWCFAGIGFVEAEILRLYGKEFNLSEMFVVRQAWAEKVAKYVRMHGGSSLSQGGEVCDVLYMIDKYGMMPESDYSGKVIGEERHMHGEMNEVVGSVARAIVKNGNKKISPAGPKAVQGVLDAYLGEVPEDFTVDGKKYTPKSFAEAYRIDPANYIEICSFTSDPYYKPCMVEIPDNWTWTPAYNMPLDELMQCVDYALEHGYTLGWAQDVSNKGFSGKTGIGIVPEDPEATLWESIVPEKKVTDEMHQQAYDNWDAGDDHSMLVVGIAKDQNGNKYYKIKNSWGTERGPYKGYWYCSEQYLRQYTIFFTLHKDALSKSMKKTLNL
ncbi:MAG: aminopeptidase [Bacteroidales bacterium]|nr:aminopeptidase [Bacteroidales bacterium]